MAEKERKMCGNVGLQREAGVGGGLGTHEVWRRSARGADRGTSVGLAKRPQWEHRAVHEKRTVFEQRCRVYTSSKTKAIRGWGGQRVLTGEENETKLLNTKQREPPMKKVVRRRRVAVGEECKTQRRLGEGKGQSESFSILILRSKPVTG